MMKFLSVGLVVIVFCGFVTPQPQRWERVGEKVDPVNIDIGLLKQSIIDYINYRRFRTHRGSIQSSLKLDKVVADINSKYKKKDLYKRRRKLNRDFYLKGQQYNFRFSWFKTSRASVSSMPVNGKKCFYKEDEQKYMYGSSEALKNKQIKLFPVRLLTYRELAKQLMLKSFPASNRRWLSVSDVNLIGLDLKVNKSNFPDRIPSVGVLYVVSGKVLPTKL